MKTDYSTKTTAELEAALDAANEAFSRDYQFWSKTLKRPTDSAAIWKCAADGDGIAKRILETAKTQGELIAALAERG